MILQTTNKFKKSVKVLKRKHNARALADLWSAIKKIYNQEVGSSMSNHKLSGKNTRGFNDLHLAGGDLILLYRYDVDSDTLVISAMIKDIVNHDELSARSTFSEPQWVDTTLKDLDNLINGSTDIYSELDENEILDWFFDYYNSTISKILPVDDIKVVTITDLGDRVRIKARGTQYHSTCDNDRFIDSQTRLNTICKKDDIRCSLIRYMKRNSDEFTILYILTVPLEVEN